MRLNINKYTSSPIEFNLSNNIHCSFAQNSEYIAKIKHRRDLSYCNQDRAHNANKVSLVVCHNPNTVLSFWDIYKSPRNALSDSASCIQVLNRDCKRMPEHVMEEIYGLKIQLTKILYEDNKCVEVSKKVDMNKINIGFEFEIEDNFYCWHIPDYKIPFKYHINNMDGSDIIKPLYCTPNVKHMTFRMKKKLAKWVINNWKNNNIVNQFNQQTIQG